MMSLTSAARRLLMQLSITVRSPKGSSGLKAPMRRERPAASRMALMSFKCLTRLCQLLKRPQRIFPRHLFPPVHDKVGVVQRPGFVVAGFGGGLDMFFVKRLAD